MIFSIKELTETERMICEKTISSKAIYALVGDAIMRKAGMSIVRLGDGEGLLLKAKDETIFLKLERDNPGWGKRMGIEGLSLDAIKKMILEAGNACTYFAPSVSGISYKTFRLYDLFEPRDFYLDNFFVNDWTKEMIQVLFESSDGVFILHSNYKKIIQNFKKNYSSQISFDGFPKNSWKDNEAAIQAAINSNAQLILFSGGPAGKILGPKIASVTNKVVLDIGNTLLPWSEDL
jgi:hypothetical protein